MNKDNPSLRSDEQNDSLQLAIQSYERIKSELEAAKGEIERLKKHESALKNSRKYYGTQTKKLREILKAEEHENLDELVIFVEDKLQLATEALEKIADPRLLGHTEPDYQTRYYCLINLAESTLAKIKAGS